MRAKIAGLALTFTAAAIALGAGCGGGSTPGGAAGTGGKAGTGGGAGMGSAGTGAAGTGSAGTGSAGTGAAGTGAAGTGAAGTGAAGTGAAGTGAAGTGSAGTGAAGTGAAGTGVPTALAVPVGATLKMKWHAVGDQIYTCTAATAPADGGTDAGTDAGGTTTYSWVLKAPDAKLYDDNNLQVGSHFAGPTWMSTVDGSDVVGARVAGVASPMSDAIDRLLLKAVSHMGTGIFSNITYVQRLNTTKGKAPATGCDANAVGMETKSAYTADYYFYQGGAVTPDGGAPADWPFTAVTIPPAIEVPAGPTLKLKLHAIGAQIYTCTAMGGADAGADAGATTYAYVLKAPDAKLYDENNAEVGLHSAGPTWAHKDGSSVVGARVAGVAAPIIDAIDRELHNAAAHGATAGTFSDVTYVQRVNTTKGKAPATGCDSTKVGTDTRVNYTADYYYYKGDATADGGTD
jgi:hypothetical protein